MFPAERVTDSLSDVDYSPMAVAAEIYEIIFCTISFKYMRMRFLFNDLPRLEINLHPKSHLQRENKWCFGERLFRCGLNCSHTQCTVHWPYSKNKSTETFFSNCKAKRNSSSKNLINMISLLPIVLFFPDCLVWVSRFWSFPSPLKHIRSKHHSSCGARGDKKKCMWESLHRCLFI